MRSFHLKAVKTFPSYGGSYEVRSLLVRSTSTLETVGQMRSSNLEAHRSSCESVLCDDGHELSSLPDQTTQG